MGNEAIAAAAFRDGLHGRPLQDLNKVRQISKVTSPHNWATLAMAGRCHAEDAPWSEFDKLCQTTSSEVGSPLYDGTWSIATYASAPTEDAQVAYRAMLAWAALCLAPVELFQLTDLRGTWSRFRDEFDDKPDHSMAQYRGPISISPGNRFEWDTSEVSKHVERSLCGTLAAWAQGGTWRWDGWDHASHGWAMEAAAPAGKAPSGHTHAEPLTLPTRPEDLVALVGRLPMRGSQRYDLLLFANGRKLCVLNASTGPNTRGPALVTEFDGQKTMRIHSPAVQTGGGSWTHCKASLDDDGWTTWQSGNASKVLNGSFGGEIEHHIVWDKNGARIMNAEPEKLPRPVPETTAGLIEFDQAGRKVAAQGDAVDGPERDERMRTWAEVGRRIMEDTKSSAKRGTETLLADMTRLDW